MKRFVKCVFSIILCAVIVGTGCAETVIDLDLSQVNRNITYAQMLQVLSAPADHAGKIFRLKGRFNYAESKDLARIIFSDSTGCCEVAVQFIPSGSLRDPEDYPPLYGEFLITARLEMAPDGAETACRFVDAVIEWGEEGAGK